MTTTEPRTVSCGCCTNGCTCANHQYVDMGRPAKKCDYHTAKWVDWRGSNMTTAEVCRLISQMCGSSYTVTDLERTIRIGGMYRNGGIWFQRVA